ncbi:MAG: hypothetical protein AB1746_04795 [Candidatus Zixiibacteriota bacterium]
MSRVLLLIGMIFIMALLLSSKLYSQVNHEFESGLEMEDISLKYTPEVIVVSGVDEMGNVVESYSLDYDKTIYNYYFSYNYYVNPRYNQDTSHFWFIPFDFRQSKFKLRYKFEGNNIGHQDYFHYFREYTWERKSFSINGLYHFDKFIIGGSFDYNSLNGSYVDSGSLPYEISPDSFLYARVYLNETIDLTNHSFSCKAGCDLNYWQSIFEYSYYDISREAIYKYYNDTLYHEFERDYKIDFLNYGKFNQVGNQTSYTPSEYLNVAIGIDYLWSSQSPKSYELNLPISASKIILPIWLESKLDFIYTKSKFIDFHKTNTFSYSLNLNKYLKNIVYGLIFKYQTSKRIDIGNDPEFSDYYNKDLNIYEIGGNIKYSYRKSIYFHVRSSFINESSSDRWFYSNDYKFKTLDFQLSVGANF